MIKKSFEQTLKKLISQRNVLSIAVVALSIVAIKLSASATNRDERIVIVPTNGTSFWVEKNRASKEYISSIGVFLSDLLFTRTPSDVAWRNKQIFEHIHPSHYSYLQGALIKEEEEITEKGLAFCFEPHASHVLPKTQQFIIEGQQRAYLSKTGKNPVMTQETNVKYTLSFFLDQGKIYLMNIEKEEI